MKSKKQNRKAKGKAGKKNVTVATNANGGKEQSTEVSQEVPIPLQHKPKKEVPVSSPLAKSKKRQNRKRVFAAAAAATPASLLTPKKAQNEGGAEGKEAASIAYLKVWKEDRKNWKFQKILQIWMTNNMMTSAALTDDVFSTWLEYMSGSSKKQKKEAASKATQVLKELEVKDSTADAGNVKYQRAKKIIQSLDDEVKEGSSAK